MLRRSIVVGLARAVTRNTSKILEDKALTEQDKVILELDCRNGSQLGWADADAALISS